jgi:hypothetical protein
MVISVVPLFADVADVMIALRRGTVHDRAGQRR